GGAGGVEEGVRGVGGVSSLARVVGARARGAGLGVTVQQIGGYETVAALAAAGTEPAARPAGAAAPAGAIPLTPIQHWWGAQAWPEPAHWDQAVLLTVPAEVTAERVAAALATLAGRYVAWRLGVTAAPDGTWRRR